MKFHLGILLLPIIMTGCGHAVDTASTNATASTSGISKSAAHVTLIGKSGIEVLAPATWKSEKDKVGAISFSSPDDGVFISFIACPDAVKAEDFGDALKTHHKKSKNFKQDGPPVAVQVGALQSSQESGSFEDEGEQMSWKINMVKGKTPVVIYSLTQKSFQDKNATETKALMDSIKATG